MKRFLTTVLMAVAFLVPLQALGSPPVTPPVTSPEMTKSVTIRSVAGLISKEVRAAVEDLLQRDLNIHDVKWRTAEPDSKVEVEILDLSEGLDAKAVLEIVWETIDVGCPDDY